MEKTMVQKIRSRRRLGVRVGAYQPSDVLILGKSVNQIGLLVYTFKIVINQSNQPNRPV